MTETTATGIPAIGEVIRAWRQFRKLSSTELAEKAGVRIGYLSEIEHNRTANPKPKYLEKLAAALEVPLLDIHARRTPPDNGGGGTMPSPALPAASIHTIAHPAKAPRNSLSDTTGEHIERLIASARLSEEEEEKVAAALFEITKQLLVLMETQRGR